jgi:beta-glucosidase
MTMIERKDFPKNFVWGAATSSYQIEGATKLDGRGASIWDTFAAIPGKTRNGDGGDPGCDHYHRWASDLDLMKDMGLEAYRFSVAWPRVLPTGRGQVNEKGMAFYEQLVDGLLERGITPWLTLYHWDLPQALDDLGGWPARETVHAFEEYTQLVSGRLGDRVKHWITHNEPWCTAFLGYTAGYFAPGLHDKSLELQTSHHLLLSHGLAVPIIRGNSSGAQVGITLNLSPTHAASDSAQDVAAAQRQDGFTNRWYLDPLYGRGYPKDMQEIYREHLPTVHNGDLEKIAVLTDFLGVNYYQRALVKHETDAGELEVGHVRSSLPRTGFDWEIYPDGMRELMVNLNAEYPVKALYITENGSCYDDALVNGAVDDEARRKYLEQHLEAALAAVRDGAPLNGYFAWSLMDNFEWAEGYARRFGMVHVDFETQARTIKKSGLFYRHFLRAGDLD